MSKSHLTSFYLAFVIFDCKFYCDGCDVNIDKNKATSVRMVDTTVDLNAIPLSALKTKSREYIAVYLDATKILLSSDGLSRDWRGIFQLSGLPSRYESFLSNKMNPTIELIKILEKEPHHKTFAEYRKMLGDIDRWDVVDDTYEFFGKWDFNKFWWLKINQKCETVKT